MIRIFRHYISTAYLWLMFFECLTFFLSIYLGAGVRYLYTSSWYSNTLVLETAIVFSFMFFISCSALGLYRKTLDVEEYNLLQRISFSFAIAILLLVLIYYIIPGLMLDRSILVISIVFSFVGMLLTRYLFYRFSNHDKLVRHVLVLGCGKRAVELSHVNSKFVYRGFEIVGYVLLDDETPLVENPIKLGNISKLTDIVDELKVDEVVIAIDDRRKILPVEDLLDLKMSGLKVLDLLSFYEKEQRFK